jgi:hypothetical protein
MPSFFIILFNGYSLAFPRKATIIKYQLNYSGFLKNLPR